MIKGKTWEFKSDLQITGSCGVELTADVPGTKNFSAGLTKQAFQVTDHKNGQKVWLDFHGIGAGGSIGHSMLGSFGFSGSLEDFFSIGTHFYSGVINYGAVELDEMINREVLIYSGSLSAGKGGGLTLMFVRPLPVLPFPVAWHSIVAVAGLSLSSNFGGGLAQYYGLLTRSSK